MENRPRMVVRVQGVGLLRIHRFKGKPQEYSRNIMEYKDPGRYFPIIFLLYSWGSLFGVPSEVPLRFLIDPWKAFEKSWAHLSGLKDKRIRVPEVRVHKYHPFRAPKSFFTLGFRIDPEDIPIYLRTNPCAPQVYTIQVPRPLGCHRQVCFAKCLPPNFHSAITKQSTENR